MIKMARYYMPLVLAKHIPVTSFCRLNFLSGNRAANNLNTLLRNTERVFSTPLFSRTLCHYSLTSGANLKYLIQSNDQSGGVTLNSFNHNERKVFSTSFCKLGRSNKFPLEMPHSQTFHGAGPDSKRRRSSNGQLNSNVDFKYIRNKKLQLKETRLKINRRFGNLKTSFFVHKKLSDKLLEQQSRGGFIRRLKGSLVVKRENIKTIPNLLTTLRLMSAPLLSYLVINDYFGCALTIFVLAGMTDVLDGYIARNFKNQRTAFGTALDPLADKFLMSFLTISLTTSGLIPVPLTVLILGRDAGLVIASFFIRYISLAPPRTLARYFDFSLVTAKVYPSNISKINTGIQLSFVACTLAGQVFDFMGSPWLEFLMYTTAATTFLSGADYVVTWRRRLKIIKNK